MSKAREQLQAREDEINSLLKSAIKAVNKAGKTVHTARLKMVHLFTDLETKIRELEEIQMALERLQ